MGELEGHHWIFEAELPGPPLGQELERALDAVVVAVNMEAIPGMRLVSVRLPAWDALQIIAESHITLHGVGGQACADVFSCKPFDANAVRRALRAHLGGVWEGRPVARGRGRGSRG